MEQNKKLQIDPAYLEELIDMQGRSIVGKILKRFELISDKEVLKSVIKEQVYEEMRHFKDLLVAHNYGYNVSVFKFK